MTVHTYLQTVTAVSILCGVIRSLTEKTAQRAAVSMFCGICTLTAVLLPLKTGVDELSRLKRQLFAFTDIPASENTLSAASDSERLTREYAARAADSYLEAQFSALTGKSCTVQVELDRELHPISAKLEAEAAYRDILLRLCKETLGLDAEALEFSAWEAVP